MDDGPKARAYANGFIGRHLQTIAGGETYSEVSAASQADPNNAQLAAQTQMLFRGETLRATLLNAWGWWTVGTYTLYDRYRTRDRDPGRAGCAAARAVRGAATRATY